MTIWSGTARFAGSGSVAVACRLKALIALTTAGTGLCSIAAGTRARSSAVLAGAGSLTAATTTNQVRVTFAGTGSLSALDKRQLAATASFAGAGNQFAHPAATYNHTAIFAGAGSFYGVNFVGIGPVCNLRLGAAARLSGSGRFLLVTPPHVAVARFTGSGLLAAAAFKPIHKLIAQFAGAGGMSIITVSPRLSASAHFVGNGVFTYWPNSSGAVLSTKYTHRYSFPTVPNPNDPFVRRPNKDYSNYAISVRFIGSGRITAIAS